MKYTECMRMYIPGFKAQFCFPNTYPQKGVHTLCHRVFENTVYKANKNTHGQECVIDNTSFMSVMNNQQW